MSRRPARPLFPGAARLEGSAVIRQGGGSPALFLRTLSPEGRAGLFRLPEDVGVTFQAGEKRKGTYARAVFSSPDASQVLSLSEAAYVGLLEALARLLEARQEGPVEPSEDLPGRGHSLRCAALIFEEGRPALYLGTAGPDFAPHVLRVPDDARVSLEAPHPLPEEKRGRAAPLRARVILETPRGRAALGVSTVHTARAFLDALEAYGQARQAYQMARAHFEGGPGGEGKGQGAA